MSSVCSDERAVELTAELKELFAKRFGHELTEKQLEKALMEADRIARGVELSTKEYIQRVRTLPLESSLVQDLISTSMNKESYFFRDTSSTATLRDVILAELIERNRRKRSLRIWSAGCSTGEEIYTIAILLQELIPDFDRWSISLLGTDIDLDAIAFARKAVYRQWSLRSATETQIRRYFEHDPRNNTYALRSAYRSAVQFSFLNLAEPVADSPPLPQYDLVLCRNVTIYLSAKACTNLSQRIRRSLLPGGIWVTGPSDPARADGLPPRVLPGLLAYDMGRAATASPPPRRTATVAKTTGFQQRLILPTSSPSRTDEVRAPRPTTGSSLHSPPGTPPLFSATTDGSQNPLDGDSLDHLVEKARQHADRGSLVEALRLLDRIVESAPTFAEAYRMRSLIHDTNGETAACEKDLRRLLYLEPENAEAHLRLGFLLSRIGKSQEAIRAMRNAITSNLSAGGDARDPEIESIAGLHLNRLLELRNND